MAQVAMFAQALRSGGTLALQRAGGMVWRWRLVCAWGRAVSGSP
jgi:hypothetical protein